MKETWGVVTLKKTGEKIIMFKRLSWNKIYYSFDNENWGKSKGEAFKLAKHTKPVNDQEGYVLHTTVDRSIL